MIGTLLRRTFELALTVLAAYAFFFIPVGHKTPYQHLVDILSTEPAREAAADFRSAGTELAGRILEESKTAAHGAADAGRAGRN
jgi:hypothetical protein